MAPEHDAKRELQEQLDKLERLVTPVHMNRSGNSVVHIHAGSWMGVILMFAASFVLGVALATSADVSARMSKIETKQDEQDQYIHAIYMMAPQLKPKGENHASQ